MLKRVPGVGKKTADRLLVELRGRFKAWETMPAISDLVTEVPPLGAAASAEQDAISALVSLGFKPQEASKAIAAISDKSLSSEELIRHALKGMGK